MSRLHTKRALMAACLAVAAGFSSSTAQEKPSGYTFRSRSELVLVNVQVRDKHGDFVRDLKPEDFTVLEDNKPQKIVGFDLEDTGVVPEIAGTGAVLGRTAGTRTLPASPSAAPTARPEALRNRRLIVLFFDMSSMQPDEVDRAQTAAENYVARQMTPADLVAVVTLGTSLQVAQDFTADREQLQKALRSLGAGSGEGFAEGSTGGTEGTADTAQPFTVDDTEYNIFNTDRRLQAIRSLAGMMAHIEQKKSVIYFSSGMDRTGVENQSQLRAAINEAVKANLAVYTLDIRGLQAMVPGGEAQNASLRGTSAYSGRSVLNQYDSNFATQETLATIAGDTGGRAFLDTNDFGKIFTAVQQDTALYYVLAYRSSNGSRDGRFRKIAVRVDRPDLKLDYRRGYYAPADYQHSSKDDREQQLEEELAAELPTTDLPVYLSAGYFRQDDHRFYVPVSIIVPGSAIPFTHGGNQDRATLDVLGIVLDEAKRPMGRVRDTVKLNLEAAQEVRRKNVQYNTAFLLPPGKFHLKFVVRENQAGRLGSFESDVTVPELKALPVRISSVMISGQLQSASKKKSENPLVRDGAELVPSVTHVFTTGQHLYVYYEVYDPEKSAAKSQDARHAAVRLLSNVSFFQGKVKSYETPSVEMQQVNVPERHAVAFQLDVPLAQLRPGFYTCQVNVIDDAAGRFIFPRLALLIRAPAP